MKTRIACLLLTAMLLALTACGPAQQANAPEAETSGETEGLYGTEPASSEDFTTMDSTEQDTTTDGESAVGGTTAAGKTTVKAEVKAPVGSSTAQVVEFYNQYANAVKAANRITIKKHNVSEMTMDIPSVLKALMPSDAGDFDPNKNETITETFVNGKGTENTSLKLNDFLPVNGKNYVSQLKASHVQSASCAKQGDNWVVTIKLKDEPLDMSSMGGMSADMSEADRQKMMDDYMSKSGYGSSMEIGFGGGAGGFGGGGNNEDREPPAFMNRDSMTMEGGFKNGTIVAVFNSQGQLTSLMHSYNMNMGTSMLGMKMNMSNSVKQEYQFTL